MEMANHADTDEAELAAIRDMTRALCARFPGDYWRQLDRERAYPTAFVNAMAEAGLLAALIPEEYGGSGLSLTVASAILEEVHASGANAAACHAQMYTMGTVLRHGNEEQKRLSAGHRQRLAAAASLRRHRAERRDRHAVDRRPPPSARRQLRRQGPEDLDQPRRAFRPDDPARPHRAERPLPSRTDGLSVFIVDMKAARRRAGSASGRSGR